MRRTWIGIPGGSRPLPPRVRARLNHRAGVEVVEVMPDSPAARAGLKVEDLIIEIDRQALTSVDDLQKTMTADQIGQGAAFTVFRNGETREIPVVPELLPTDEWLSER